VWTEFKWLKTGISSRLINMVMNFRVTHKVRIILMRHLWFSRWWRFKSSFGLWHHVVMWQGIKLSEDFAASISKVKMEAAWSSLTKWY